MGIRAGFLILWVATVTAASENTGSYSSQIEIRGESGSERVETLKQEAVLACMRMQRANIAIQHFWNEIRNYFGDRGVNFPVLYKNRAFYSEAIRHRLTACVRGKIRLYLYGRCGTDEETLAFVRTPFGIVLPTIYICDEYFEQQDPSNRILTLVHEFGRLEGIGDSEAFDTNNIRVWDMIMDRLTNSRDFEAIRNLAAE